MMFNVVDLYISKMRAKSIIAHAAGKSPVFAGGEYLSFRHLGLFASQNAPSPIHFDPPRVRRRNARNETAMSLNFYNDTAFYYFARKNFLINRMDLKDFAEAGRAEWGGLEG